MWRGLVAAALMAAVVMTAACGGGVEEGPVNGGEDSGVSGGVGSTAAPVSEEAAVPVASVEPVGTGQAGIVGYGAVSGEAAATAGARGADSGDAAGTGMANAVTVGQTAIPAAAATARATAELRREPTQESAVGPTARSTVEVVDEPSDHPGRPHYLAETLEALEALPEDEYECLPEDVRNGDVETSVELLSSAWQAAKLTEAAACLSDESVVRVMIMPALLAEVPLDGGSVDCLVGSGLGSMVRRTLPLGGEFYQLDAALFAALAGLALQAELCMSDEQFALLELRGTELDRLRCIVATPEDAEALLVRILDGGPEEGPEAVDEAVELGQPCLLLYPPEPLVEPYAECTGEDREAGALCREE